MASGHKHHEHRIATLRDVSGPIPFTFSPVRGPEGGKDVRSTGVILVEPLSAKNRNATIIQGLFIDGRVLHDDTKAFSVICRRLPGGNIRPSSLTLHHN